jgi:hypothetical protein
MLRKKTLYIFKTQMAVGGGRGCYNAEDLHTVHVTTRIMLFMALPAEQYCTLDAILYRGILKRSQSTEEAEGNFME